MNDHQSEPSTGEFNIIILLLSITLSWALVFGFRFPLSASTKKNKNNLTSTTTEAYNVCPVVETTPVVSKLYNYLRSVETKRRPMIDYMQKVQTDIDPNWRGICIDWAVNIVDDFQFLPDTIYLTVSCIDRFLSFKPISGNKLPSLCLSSILIASKYEDTCPTYVEQLCYMIDDELNKEEILEMEVDILKTLNFDTGIPTINTFLRKFEDIACEKNNDLSLQFEFLSNYLAELSLLDYDCLRFLPSLVAASVTFLARFIVWPKTYPWATLQEYTGYKQFELKECVLILHDLYMARRKGTLHFIRQKYKKQEYECVANLPSPSRLPSYLFEVEQGGWMKLCYILKWFNGFAQEA